MAFVHSSITRERAEGQWLLYGRSQEEKFTTTKKQQEYEALSHLFELYALFLTCYLLVQLYDIFKTHQKSHTAQPNSSLSDCLIFG